MSTPSNIEQAKTNSLAEIEPWLGDPDITEIMIDGCERIYIEKRGQIQQVDSPFKDNSALLDLVNTIFREVGRPVDESRPLMDARLSDGTTVNIVLPPISQVGPLLTFQKPATNILTFDDLLRFGTLTEDMVQFLQACVASRLNMVIAGGIDSGKSTILNLVANLVDDKERIIYIETGAQLQLQKKKRLVTLESRPAPASGQGAVTVADLLLNVPKMRADRLVIGELVGGEVYELLKLLNLGYDGLLTSMQANSVRDALARLEMMASLADASVPLLAVREMMASALDIIVHQSRLQDGTRKILSITEVVGRHGDGLELSDLFVFRQTGQAEGRVIGHTVATGQIPHLLERMQAAKVDLPLSMFTPK